MHVSYDPKNGNEIGGVELSKVLVVFESGMQAVVATRVLLHTMLDVGKVVWEVIFAMKSPHAKDAAHVIMQ